MLANVFTKSVRDRWIGPTIAVGSLALLLWWEMAVYRDIDVSFYADLPEAYRQLVGIPEGADISGLAFGTVYGLMAALALAGIAISMGSGAIAGEERKGTLDLLLANPRSRTGVLIAKAGSMVILVGLAASSLWVVAELIPTFIDVDITGIHVGSLVLHLGVNALFYGFLALAIGSSTGKGSLASGGTAAIMIVSYLAAEILPLADLTGLAKVFPWWYYSGSNPVTNGVDWGDLAVLVVSTAAFFAVALVGVNRRDLRGTAVGATIVDRLRAHPMTRRFAARLAGSARVSGIIARTLTEHRGMVVLVGTVLFYAGVIMGPFFRFIDDAIVGLVEQLPDSILAMVGSADMSTPAGWLTGEVFALTAPIGFIVATAVVGARSTAGEEENHTMDLLLASPVARSKVVLQKTTAMVGLATILGVVIFAGTTIGVLLASLDVSVAGIAAASLLCTLLSLAFGAFAVLIGSLTGRTRVAGLTTAAVVVVAYVTNSFLPLSENLAGWAKLSPFHYYLGNDPLNNGLSWADAGILAGLFVVIFGASLLAFERRDLRG